MFVTISQIRYLIKLELKVKKESLLAQSPLNQPFLFPVKENYPPCSHSCYDHLNSPFYLHLRKRLHFFFPDTQARATLQN